jgi:formylglycine-generating enzyme required for sulfatase activity
LPVLGSGKTRRVPMLTLTALEEEDGLHITTQVLEVPVWRLPLPAGEQLELVALPGGEHRLGSAAGEPGRDVYAQARQRCEQVDVEADRTVELEPYLLVRHPINQAQWRVVVEATAEAERGGLKAGPGTFRPEGLWEGHGQPGALPVDSVSWTDCRQWLGCLNAWLHREWGGLGGQGEAPVLALPSESQWEAACRAGAPTPFHYGATLDPSWARYDASTSFGMGRKGADEPRPAPIGFAGLVNARGLADLHGQLDEWCADQWHRDPVGEGWPADGSPWEGVDPGLADVPVDREFKLLRGGSWFNAPHHCRSAFRGSDRPGARYAVVGFRVCCLPPGSLLGP